MYLLEKDKPNNAERAWREYIEREAGDCAEDIAPGVRDQIVHALARYCEEESRSGVLRSEMIPQLFRRTARNLLASATDTGDEDLLDQSSQEPLPKQVEELIGLGWLSELGGRVCNPGRNWLLDLRMLVGQPERALDMSILLAVRNALNAVAPVWDSSRGKGIIALRGAQTLARHLHPARRSNASALVLEMRNYAESLLIRIGEQRSWREQPQVVVRDLT